MSNQEPQAQPVSPSMQMMQILWPGAIAVQAIHVAAKFALADLIASGPKSIEELAEATHTHGSSLGRFLRALTSLGIFAEDTTGRYRQTALSDTLRSDHPESIRPSAMMLGAHFVWEPSGALEETVRTGQPSFERVYGAPFFEYLAGHSDDAAVFNAAMSSSPDYLAAIVGAYDFSKFERIVDVGGGHGRLLAGILIANPRLRGVLYDLPDVVAEASALRQEPISQRCEIIGGDFFKGVPAGADAYLLKGIIHDWNDEAALKILKNCRRAIHPDGRLLVVDAVLTRSTALTTALMDMLMMVLTSGQERTEPEFRSLLQEAGFSMVQVIRAAGVSMIESRPV
ncbi:MAG TPA: methyltransferase [Candidatus Acidoferrales bacterium]|nr:methyltransferase [Candidatus Acidoferrales bacterium]